MKLLVIIPTLEFGGAQNIAVDDKYLEIIK